MKNSMKKIGVACVMTALFGCGSDSDSSGSSSGNEPSSPTPTPELSQLTIAIRDANLQSHLTQASVKIGNQYKDTNAQGEVTYEVEDGVHTITVNKTGYHSTESQVLIAGNDSSVVMDLEAQEVIPAPEEMFIFHSQNDDSYYMQYWGDTWGSGALVQDVSDDPDYPKVLKIDSGTNWGNGAGIAWGNEQVNAIDTSSYTHAKFALKTTTFTTVQVNVQGFGIPDFSSDYPISSGVPLSNGWVQFEVPIPTTYDLKWFGLVFTSDQTSSVLLSDVSFITKEVSVSQPSVPAPTPEAIDSEVFSIFSDSLSEDKFVSLWNENWWNAPFYSAGSIEGNNYARYEILGSGAEGGVVGIQYGIEYGSVDVSEHNTWNMDLYVEPGINRVMLQLVSGDGSSTYSIDNPQAGQWLSLQIPFLDMAINGNGALNTAQMQMAGIQLWGEAGKAIFVDNIYFSGQSNSYDLNVSVKDSFGAALQNAEVIVGIDGEHDVAYKVMTNSSGVATLVLSEGVQKVKAVADGYGVTQQLHTVDSGAASLNLTLSALNPGPVTAAPTPNVSSNEVISLFSDNLDSPHYITYWSDPWWNPPVHSMINIGGNATAKFQITPDGTSGGVTGIQYGVQEPVDASAMTGLRFDFYATSGVTKAQFQLLSQSGPLIYDLNNVQHGQWVTVELGFDALGADASYNKAAMQQLGMALWGTTSDSVYLDNIYFY
ncbi:carboxypeptidase-like regulatory domain-containing protein [Vibrio breoganii]|uniref:carboxypeptidase-like regulatory domain-containing protein n=1 Tax=Vibrio breoganii TaxID=553239 RepID=UPI001F52D16F|nr:carboxypeptidase-like regulatory domain-containing protein [Vibrio breoganii]